MPTRPSHQIQHRCTHFEYVWNSSDWSGMFTVTCEEVSSWPSTLQNGLLLPPQRFRVLLLLLTGRVGAAAVKLLFPATAPSSSLFSCLPSHHLNWTTKERSMPPSQLHFSIRHLLFSSRENKAVNGAKASQGLSAEAHWPAHVVRKGDDTAVPPQHPLLSRCGEENWSSETRIPAKRGKLIHTCILPDSASSVCPQENQRTTISIGSSWVLQYSQTTAAVSETRSFSLLPMTAPGNCLLRSGIPAPGQQQLLLNADHQLQKHGCPDQEEVLPNC